MITHTPNPLITLPVLAFGVFALCIAAIVVPYVVSIVVPAVVEAVVLK